MLVFGFFKCIGSYERVFRDMYLFIVFVFLGFFFRTFVRFGADILYFFEFLGAFCMEGGLLSFMNFRLEIFVFCRGFLIGIWGVFSGRF